MAAQDGPARAAEDSASSAVFATVGGTVITVQEFQSGLQAVIRQRYFHGSVPASALVSLRREVAQSLIDHVLLEQEAGRRGIKPEQSWIDMQIRDLEGRLQADSQPQEVRASVLADARAQLAGASLVRQLQERVEDIPPPDGAAVRAYYRDHPDKFTTPERMRVSMILLKVEPWAPATTWSAAEEEGGRLIDQLRHGADFAELARLHSADASAPHGGDLGYVHKGMFSDETQRVIDGLAIGELSAPVRLLQGYAIFRLDERVPPRLNEYERVEERARGLLHREQQTTAWEGLLVELRDKAEIKISEAALTGGE